jgi:hypothetical protein
MFVIKNMRGKRWRFLNFLKREVLGNKKPGYRISIRYFGNPAVSQRPCGLSAPSSRMV